MYPAECNWWNTISHEPIPELTASDVCVTAAGLTRDSSSGEKWFWKSVIIDDDRRTYAGLLYAHGNPYLTFGLVKLEKQTNAKTHQLCEKNKNHNEKKAIMNVPKFEKATQRNSDCSLLKVSALC